MSRVIGPAIIAFMVAIEVSVSAQRYEVSVAASTVTSLELRAWEGSIRQNWRAVRSIQCHHVSAWIDLVAMRNMLTVS